MKLICADDLLEHAEVNGESEEFVNKLSDYIKDAPKMNRQGVWQRSALYCSECGRQANEPFAFCPHCGADMRT